MTFLHNLKQLNVILNLLFATVLFENCFFIHGVGEGVLKNRAGFLLGRYVNVLRKVIIKIWSRCH
jgi:hypothetical protein